MTSVKKGTVPFFNYPYVFSSQEEAFMSIIRDVGCRGAFIVQKDLCLMGDVATKLRYSTSEVRRLNLMPVRERFRECTERWGYENNRC